MYTIGFMDEAESYCVRVVHYERDGSLLGYQKEPAVPNGRTAEELAQDIHWLKEAFDLPILTVAELDAELATHLPKPKPQQRKTKTLEQLMAELEQTDTPADASALSEVAVVGQA